MKILNFAITAVLIAANISSLGAQLPSPSHLYNTRQLFSAPSPHNSPSNMEEMKPRSSIQYKSLAAEDSIVGEADYGSWNPRPYYNRDHAAPIPHAKVRN